MSKTAAAGIALCASSLASAIPAEAADTYGGCGNESLCVYQNISGGGARLSIPISSFKKSGWVNLTGRWFNNGLNANDQVSSVWVHSSSACVTFTTDINGGGQAWGMGYALGGKADSVPYNDQFSSFKYDNCTG